jgi:hypothetical protein
MVLKIVVFLKLFFNSTRSFFFLNRENRELLPSTRTQFSSTGHEHCFHLTLPCLASINSCLAMCSFGHKRSHALFVLSQNKEMDPDRLLLILHLGSNYSSSLFLEKPTVR